MSAYKIANKKNQIQKKGSELFLGIYSGFRKTLENQFTELSELSYLVLKIFVFLKPSSRCELHEVP